MSSMTMTEDSPCVPCGYFPSHRDLWSTEAMLACRVADPDPELRERCLTYLDFVSEIKQANSFLKTQLDSSVSKWLHVAQC